MERATPSLDTGSGISGFPFLLLPIRYILARNLTEYIGLKLRQEVVFEVPPVVLHRRRGQVDTLIPGTGVLPEGHAQLGRRTPWARLARVLRFRKVSGAFRLAFRI